jgi:hypothetical protein
MGNFFKRFSYSQLRSTEGVDHKHQLDKEISQIVETLQKGSGVTLNEINRLTEFLFSVPGINKEPYVLSSVMNYGTFTFDSIKLKTDQNNDIEQVIFVLKEISLGTGIEIHVPCESFHEMFQQFKPKFPVTKES